MFTAKGSLPALDIIDVNCRWNAILERNRDLTFIFKLKYNQIFVIQYLFMSFLDHPYKHSARYDDC